MNLKLVVFCIIIAAAVNAADYWQQDVAYRIKVTLDTEAHTLTGAEQLTYTNNSPDSLSFIRLHTYPNAYRDDNSVYAREKRAAASTRFHFAKKDERGFMEIRSLTLDGQELERREKPDDGTELQVFLPQPLPPGGQIALDIQFFVKLPFIFSRLGHIGRHYEISQWYPKMVVYDRFGWHPDGYHAVGEFYGEFGSFDVEITAPKDLVIAATGVLIEPQEELERLNELARQGAELDSMRNDGSKSALKKIKEIHKEVEKREKSEETKTVRFVAERVHDFCWCADRRFIVKRGKYDEVDINIYVLPKNEAGWKDAVQYVQNTLRLFGGWYMPFPYPQQSVVDGDMSAGGGMEYPMLTIISSGGSQYTRFLESVIMHEVGHNWFYGILGSNEMAEAWLDEGMNTFSERRFMRTLYGREGNLFTWGGKSKWLPSFSDDQMQQLTWYLAAANHAEAPMLTTPYEMADERYGAMVYAKGSFVLDMLQDRFGEETFDRIMQTYFERWQFKHPTTADFQQIVKEVTGENMDDFFRQWIYELRTADLRIKSVKKRGTDEYQVTVDNRGDASVGADVTLETRSGEKLTQRWNGGSAPLTFQASSFKSVAVDPPNAVPEVNNWNNVYPRPVQVRPFLAFPPFDKHLILARPTVWYDDDVDGWRPGLAVNGGNWRTLGPIPGFHEWRAGVSYGASSGQWNYDLGYGTNISLNQRLYRVQTEITDVEGRVRSFTRVGTTLRKSPFRGSSLSLEAGWRYHRLYNLAYWEEQAWSRGTVSAAVLNVEYQGRTLLLQNTTRLSLQAGSEALRSDFSFGRVQLASTFDWRIARWLQADLRLFGGAISGEAALQDRFYLYGGVEARGPLSPLVDGRGRYSAHQRLQIPEEGGGLRGYYGRFLSGDRIAACNFEITIPHSIVKFFFDAGNVWDDGLPMNDGKWRYDAGVRVNIGPAALNFPFWISDPLPGENALEYRWLVSLSTAALKLGF